MSNNGGSGGPPYGWALIGCGSAGSGHARGAAMTPEVEVRGFCDVVPASAEGLQSEYGGYVTSDPQRIFDDPSVDIVSIATPHSMHTEPALAAIAAGKHLWLEKPMAMSTEECLQIAAAQRAAGTQLMLNFSFRFSGAVREAKRRLGTADGEPCSVSDGAGRPQPVALGSGHRRRAAVGHRRPHG